MNSDLPWRMVKWYAGRQSIGNQVQQNPAYKNLQLQIQPDNKVLTGNPQFSQMLYMGRSSKLQ